jgi:hypothetical protein
MPVSELQINQFERVLFRIALGMGAVIVAVRLGAIAAFWLLRH